MSLLGKLFGRDDVIKKSVEGIYNGVDAAWYTDEEKADNHKQLLKLYEPFKIAQRLLALIICVPYSSIWALCALMYLLSAFIGPCVSIEQVCRSSHLILVAQDLAMFNHQNLSTPAGVILGFYFGGGALEGVVRAAVKK